ncbi:sortase [candidate division WWE3 bacterium]|uniref:Sortase n=1 Tax=candidate division WWE3 bacterium TaxID=2053526 RepID=A0A955LFT7_UNCKA|nr:sortase [candidate division WWE3 bacterium]
MRNIPIPNIAKRTSGVVLLLISGAMFIYLGWFYFIMPRLIVNDKDTLASAFDRETYLSLSERYGVYSHINDGQSGIIIGGVLYPFGNNGNDSSSGPSVLSASADKPSEVTLSIPELNIHNAAVQIDVDGTNEGIYQTVLRRAVAHFANTAYPGQKGNTFFFGHSKIPILAGSDYESIFTNLPRIKNGAIVEVKTSNAKYRYRVNYTAVLSPKDVFILNQPKEERLLTLMTCIPPGFGSNRYVAVANLVGVEGLTNV